MVAFRVVAGNVCARRFKSLVADERCNRAPTKFFVADEKFSRAQTTFVVADEKSSRAPTEFFGGDETSNRAPIKFFATASGLIIDKVRSKAIFFTPKWVFNQR